MKIARPPTDLRRCLACCAWMLVLFAAFGVHSPHDLHEAAATVCHPGLAEHVEVAVDVHSVCFGCLVRLQTAGSHLSAGFGLAAAACETHPIVVNDAVPVALWRAASPSRGPPLPA